MEHPENYKYYLNVTKYDTYRINVDRYQQYLNASQFLPQVDKIKIAKGIKKTITP